MIFLRNRLADFELHVALYYMRRGAYVGALNRAKYCIENYDGAPAVKGSLKVLIDAYRSSTWSDLAANAERVYADNYPGIPRTSSRRSPGGSGFSGQLRSRPASMRLVAAGDRVAPIAPEGAAAHAHARRRLAALVLVALHQIQNASDGLAVEAARGDLIDR